MTADIFIVPGDKTQKTANTEKTRKNLAERLQITVNTGSVSLNSGNVYERLFYEIFRARRKPLRHAIQKSLCAELSTIDNYSSRKNHCSELEAT
jgi:hypothetical protein